MIVCATLEKNGEVLLVKHSNSGKSDYGHWPLPAGSVERAESLEEALKREIKEELGIGIEIVKRLLEHRDPYTGDTLINFLCVPRSGEIKTSEELVDARWFRLSEIRNLGEIHPDLKQFLLDFLSGFASGE